MSYENGGSNFVKGAVIGGLLGCLAGILVAPKASKELRNNLADGYLSATNKARSLKNRGQRLFCLKPAAEPSFFCRKSTLITGSVIGGIVGIIAALLLAPESCKALKEHLEDSYDDIRHKAEDFIEEVNTRGRDAVDQFDGWKDTLSEVIGKLSSNKVERQCQSKLDEILDWANLALRALEKFQKKR
jgi:gas vesicle protein